MARMKKNRHRTVFRQLLAAAVVATGLAPLWVMLFGWGENLIKNSFASPRMQERLNIAVDGTPVIVTFSVNNQIDVSRRTIEGKPWPNEYENWLSGAHYSGSKQEPGLIDFPLPWKERFSGGTDGKKPPTAWYLLRNAEPQGQAYFMGFDAFSKLPIGYIGRKGFRATLPPASEHFLFPEALNRMRPGSGEMVGSQYFDSWQIVRYWRHSLNSDQRILPWLLYVAEADRLLEVDLRKRTVRTSLELPGIRKLSQLWEVVPKTPEQENEAAKPETIKTERRFGILTDDKIVIYDPPTGEQHEFALPEDKKFTDGAFNAYLLSPRQILLSYNDGYWEQGGVQQLLWITPDGKVERRERVELMGWMPVPERTTAWSIAKGVPLPIFWLGKTLLADPWNRLQANKAKNYASALRSSIEITWPPIVAVVLLSLLTAGIAMRWHRKYRRPNAGLWWLMVFLFGPMGLLAYWLQQKQAMLEPCTSCDQIVPRDRGACAACGAEFPVPKLRGTEIFA